MRKFLLSLLAVFCVCLANAETYTLSGSYGWDDYDEDFSTMITPSPLAFSCPAGKVTFSAGASTDKLSGGFVYINTGSTMTLTANEGYKITKLEFANDSGAEAAAFKVTNGNGSSYAVAQTATWTGEVTPDSPAEFSITGTKPCINAVRFTYEPYTPPVVEPEPSGKPITYTFFDDYPGDYGVVPANEQNFISYHEESDFEVSELSFSWNGATIDYNNGVQISSGLPITVTPKNGAHITKVELFVYDGAWEQASLLTASVGDLTTDESSQTITWEGDASTPLSFELGGVYKNITFDGFRFTLAPGVQEVVEPIEYFFYDNYAEEDGIDTSVPNFTSITDADSIKADEFTTSWNSIGVTSNGIAVAWGSSLDIKPLKNSIIKKIEFYTYDGSKDYSDNFTTTVGKTSREEGSRILVWEGEQSSDFTFTFNGGYSDRFTIDGIRFTVVPGNGEVEPEPTPGPSGDASEVIFQGSTNPLGAGVGTQFSDVYSNKTLANDKVSIAFADDPECDGQTVKMKYYSKYSGLTGEMTITPAEGYQITKVEFNATSGASNLNYLNYSTGNASVENSAVTWTGIATAAKPLVISNSEDSFTISYFKVSVVPDETPADFVDTPVFAQQEGSYFDTNVFTISASNEKDAIEYAYVAKDSETEPEYVAYPADGFKLPAGNWTVFAKATRDGNSSEVVSVNYTIIEDSNLIGWWVMPDGNRLENNAEITFTMGVDDDSVLPTFEANPKYSRDKGNWLRIIPNEYSEDSNDVVRSRDSKYIDVIQLGTGILRAYDYYESTENPLEDVNLTVKVVPDPTNVAAPTLSVALDAENSFAISEGTEFPFTPGMTLKLTSATPDATVSYTINGGETLTGDYVIPANLVDTDITIVAKASNGVKETEEVTFTVPVHNFVLVENAAALDENTYFIWVDQASSKSFKALPDVTTYNQDALQQFADINFSKGNLVASFSDVPLMLKKVVNSSSYYFQVMQNNQYLTLYQSYVYTNTGITTNSEVKFNTQYSVPVLGSSTYVLYINTNGYWKGRTTNATTSKTAAQLYAWMAVPAEEVTYVHEGVTYNSHEELPENVRDNHSITVNLPKGYNGVFTVNNTAISGNVLSFAGYKGETNVSFYASRDEGEEISFNKTFTVLPTNFEFFINDETEAITGNTPASVGDVLNVVAPEGTESITYTVNGGSENLVSGDKLAITFRQSGTFSYAFTARDADENVIGSASTISVAVADSSREFSFDFKNNTYGLDVTDDADNAWLTGGIYNAGFTTDDGLEMFIPGGDNFVALVNPNDQSSQQSLKIAENSGVRISAGSEKRIIKLEIYGSNLDNLAVGTTDGSNYLGEFKAIGSCEVNGDGTFLWNFDPTSADDVLDIQLWNKPATNGISAYADAPAAYVRSIYVTTDQRTGVSGISFAGDDAMWFDLQGHRVNAENLSTGIYIRIANGQTTKVFIR